MRILLDENFPLQLHRRLPTAGIHSEPVITLGQRGQSDSEIRQQLLAEGDPILLTQDTEFEYLARDVAAVVIISRVPQAWPLATRVEVWFRALEAFKEHSPEGRLSELLESGSLVRLPT